LEIIRKRSNFVGRKEEKLMKEVRINFDEEELCKTVQFNNLITNMEKVVK